MHTCTILFNWFNTLIRTAVTPAPAPAMNLSEFLMNLLTGIKAPTYCNQTTPILSSSKLTKTVVSIVYFYEWFTACLLSYKIQRRWIVLPHTEIFGPFVRYCPYKGPTVILCARYAEAHWTHPNAYSDLNEPATKSWFGQAVQLRSLNTCRPHLWNTNKGNENHACASFYHTKSTSILFNIQLQW